MEDFVEVLSSLSVDVYKRQTLKQSMDNIERVREELAQKYYAMAAVSYTHLHGSGGTNRQRCATSDGQGW